MGRPITIAVPSGALRSVLLLWGLLGVPLGAQAKPRARDLGIPFDGTPGVLNAVTDVAGVEVGYTTLVRGEGKLVRGVGPVRTGVTAIWPRGKRNFTPVMAGWFSQNGNGEMTGTAWLEESGFLEGPVMITNTHSVGLVRDAVIEWMVAQPTAQPWLLPMVAETFDGRLNDINGFHVTKAHVFAALDSAKGGPVAEGNVGGGTGMMCNGFKGGNGSASRKLPADRGGFTVGVFVQCNYGTKATARIAGIPLAGAFEDVGLCYERRAERPSNSPWPLCSELPPAVNREGANGSEPAEMGSIIIVIATDAPLLPHQLKRIARRASLGMGRVGATAGNSSGDLFVAFSTQNAPTDGGGLTSQVTMVPNGRMDPLFVATVEATEEAIVNAMVGAETMIGADHFRAPAIPHDRLQALLRKHARLRNTSEPRR